MLVTPLHSGRKLRQRHETKHVPKDPQESASQFAPLSEPKLRGSGTTRVVAESIHDGLLNPNRRWDSVRTTSVGRPTQVDGPSKRSNADEYDDRVWDVMVKASPVSKNMFTRVVSRLPDGECIAPRRVDQSR
jgi:hypothetical protein